MKYSLLRFVIVSGFYLISLIGCQRNSLPTYFPDLGIQFEEMNTDIELVAPYGWNSFRTDSVIGLAVRVTGNEPIAYTYDYGARLFILQDGEWEEVRNITTYPEGFMVVPPWENNPRNEGGIDVRPELPESDKLVLLRIVLIGNIYRDNRVTDERVGAYIDVELNP
jgi:hypothetical protein